MLASSFEEGLLQYSLDIAIFLEILLGKERFKWVDHHVERVFVVFNPLARPETHTLLAVHIAVESLLPIHKVENELVEQTRL